MAHPIWYTPEQIAADEAAKKTAIRASRLNGFRKRRDEKLAQSDWTQMPDSPLSAEQKAAWAAYRQALRDVPATANDEGWVIWPSRPG
jgi:hypothetical protein